MRDDWARKQRVERAAAAGVDAASTDVCCPGPGAVLGVLFVAKRRGCPRASLGSGGVALVEIFGDVFGWLLGDRWGRRIVKRRNDRFRAQSKTEASVRLVDGTVRGLSQQWMPAVWSVAPGRLTNFSVVVPVADLRRDESRVPGFRESLHVDAEAYIYRAKSNGATIEIALTPSQAEWVVGLLVGNESP
jgi:hypothetical protein